LPEATACPPSVVADTIMRTIELGMAITDAAINEKSTTIFCTPVARDRRCPDCGRDGRYRDTVTRPLTDLPVAGYPLVLRVAVPRYRCLTPGCARAVFIRISGSSRRHVRRRRGVAPGMCCGGY
jgi:transposase